MQSTNFQKIELSFSALGQQHPLFLHIAKCHATFLHLVFPVFSFGSYQVFGGEFLLPKLSFIQDNWLHN